MRPQSKTYHLKAKYRELKTAKKPRRELKAERIDEFGMRLAALQNANAPATVPAPAPATAPIDALVTLK